MEEMDLQPRFSVCSKQNIWVQNLMYFKIARIAIWNPVEGIDIRPLSVFSAVRQSVGDVPVTLPDEFYCVCVYVCVCVCMCVCEIECVCFTECDPMQELSIKPIMNVHKNSDQKERKNYNQKKILEMKIHVY